MSQRHLIENYNSSSAGNVHAQGVVAPSLSAQVVVDPTQLNVLKARSGDEPVLMETPPGGWVVPEGPPGGPLQGSSMSGAIPVSAQPPEPNPGPGPDPLPGEEPVLNSINPSSARLGDPDLVMNVNGNRFTNTSIIYFNGGPENTTFKSTSQLSTTVKPSTATVAGAFPVWVQQGVYATSQKTFTFLDPQVTALPTEGERTLPAGPFTISHIVDHADGIELVVDFGDIQVEDEVLIEATGNTSINGTYTVLSVSGNHIVVDNNYELLTPIDAKGRLTVTG